MAPDVVIQGEVQILQISLDRKVFLDSFSIFDVNDLEFLLSFGSNNQGIFKLIKTRDIFIIEANIGFEIDNEVKCDEDYTFPEDNLLINSHHKHLTLREIFKKRAMTEILQLDFEAGNLNISGENNNRDFKLTKHQLEALGGYLDHSGANLNKFSI